MKSIKILALGTAATLLGHLVIEIVKAGRERIFREAAGESDYERQHRNRRDR